MSSRVLLLTVGVEPAEQLSGPLERRGMTVSVASDLAAALPRLGDHQLIVLDAPDAASLALLCRRINDAAGSAHPPILAIAHSRDVEARVELLEAGADDVLARPIEERELEALVEALLMRSSATAHAQAPAAPLVQRPASAPGRVIAFGAAKGGSGTTTLAVNTALVLAEMAPGSVAIADFDMFHGQVATHLDLYGPSSTAELAREEPAGLTPEQIQEAGRLHSSGLTVFGGPYRADEGAEVQAHHLIGLADALGRVYGTVVIDVGSTLDMRALAVLEHAHRVAMVLAPDIPALRLLHGALQVMSESGAAAERAVFVVNDIYPRPMIGPEQIEEHLGIKVGLQVPYDAEIFVRAANEGQPLILLARRSAPAAAIRRLAELLADSGRGEEVRVPERRGLLRGLLGRG